MSRDPAEAAFHAGGGDSGEPLDLPLEMYFAREPESVDPGFESAVLGRVGRSRSFTRRRDRRLISWSRGVIALGIVAVVGGAAYLDRVGLAPWSGTPAPKPVSSLIESAAVGTAEPIQHVAMARDAIRESLLDAAAQHAAMLSGSADRAVTQRDAFQTGVSGATGSIVRVSAGPYLTATEPECPAMVASSEARSMIVFSDGFRVPGLHGASNSLGCNDLRWPSLEGLATSVVMLDGLPSATPPPMVSPVWYAGSRSAGDRK